MRREAGPAQEPAEPLPPSILGPGAASSAPPANDRSQRQRGARWIWGGLLVVVLALLLLVLSFAHVTAEGPAKRSLRRSVAILTEVDTFLDVRFQALRQEAAQADEEAIELVDFPIPVSFTPEEILAADREQFRALLLTRSAERVYEEGMAVFREDRATAISVFSLQGAIRGGMDFLRSTPHMILTTLTIVLAVPAAALALALMLNCRGYGRLVGLGVSLSLAAVPFLILAVAVRFTLGRAADGRDEYLAREFLTLAQELTWAGVRNGIIFSLLGLIVLTLGAALALSSDRWQRR